MQLTTSYKQHKVSFDKIWSLLESFLRQNVHLIWKRTEKHAQESKGLQMYILFGSARKSRLRSQSVNKSPCDQAVWFQDEYHSCEMKNFHFTAVVCIVLLVLLCGKDAFKADSQIALKINIEPQHLPVKMLSILDITNLVFSLCPQNALCLRTEAKVTKIFFSTHHYIHCWGKMFTGRRYSKLYSLLISVVMVW